VSKLKGGWDRTRVKAAIVIAAAAAALALCLLPTFVTPDRLPVSLHPAAAQRCVAVFILAVALWFTSIIPLPASGLLVIALLPLLNVLPADTVFSFFGNSAVFFIMGVFLLAAAMIATGLSKRITLLALQRFDRTPHRLINGVLLSAAFLALWMPSYGVAAMIYPIAVEIVDAMKLERGHAYAKRLFLALAWGSIIGSCGTILGGGRGPLALSLLEKEYPGQTIEFLQWAIACIPLVVLLTAAAAVILRVRLPDDVDDVTPATQMLDERVRLLGPMSGRERRLAWLTVLTIAAWIAVGKTFGIAVIAALAAGSLFLLRIVEWNAIQGYVNWGVIVLYGGAVVLGQSLTETHAMEWLSRLVITQQTPSWLVLALLVLVAMALTEAISNAAAVAILLPIGFALGEMTGIRPVMMTLVVTVPTGLSFLLPVSSPPNAIAFAAGHYSVREVVTLGWWLTVCAFVVMLLVVYVWWRTVLGVGAW